MKKFFEDFKAFALKGNIIDMAIGVVIGGAFGKITGSLVNDLLMPTISWICGSRNMTALNVVVRPEIIENNEVIQEAITIGFGTFLATIIDFLLIALTVFFIVKLSNKAHKLIEKKKEEEAVVDEKLKPSTEDLLKDILDELKKK